MKTTACALLAVWAASTAAFPSGNGAGLLPELQTHIEFARAALRQGRLDLAIEHAEIVAPQTLRVHICAQGPEGARAAVREAMSVWEEALDTIDFIESDAASAQVKVRFVPDLVVRGCPVGGYAVWQRGGDAPGGFSAEITLRTQFAGQTLSHHQMLQAALHEIGHVLGLSDGGTGVMGPLHLARPVTRPLESEVRLLREVRQRAQAVSHLAQVTWRTQMEGYNFRR